MRRRRAAARADAVEIGGDSRVGELRRPRVVIDEVDPAGSRVPDLPSRRKRAEISLVDLKVAGHSGVVPRGHARLGVEEVDLTLIGD